jgi:hypothetical protein
MADPLFLIEPDSARKLLRITQTGNWTMETVQRYAAALSDAVRHMMLVDGVKHGELITLIDMTSKGVLPREVADALGRMVRPDSPSRRIAFVTSGALHRLQARRLVSDPRVRIFDREADALAWLMERDAIAA